MKFQFNCKENKLYLLYPHQGDYKYLISEDNKFTTNFGGIGFILDPDQKNHWITFNFYSQKIRVFYKQPLSNNQFSYYRKDLPWTEINEWEFTKEDQVEKINGTWQKKK